MSYSENANTPFNMNVVPAGSYGNDFLGGNGAWWLIILLLFCNNGWGNGFGGGMMPWMIGANTNNDVQRGFDQNAIMSGLSGINSAISTGFANAEISRCNSQANILQTLNSISMGLQSAAYDNHTGLADLKYTVATENCADRTALNEAITNLLIAGNANTQNVMNTVNSAVGRVMDKICALELAGKDDRIAELTALLNEANRRASQNDQTAQILASQAAQTAAIEQYLRPVPQPAYIVQNPNCCSQSSTCCGAM